MVMTVAQSPTTTDNNFSVITDRSGLKSAPPLDDLIVQQLHTIGNPADPEHVRRALFEAFRPGSRAVLFLWQNRDGLPGAFAFGNVGSGLESGSDYLWINELHVEPRFRRRGLAAAMLEYIEAWAQDNGIHYLACVTGVQNQAAQGLYKSRGFDLHPVQWASKRIWATLEQL